MRKRLIALLSVAMLVLTACSSNTKSADTETAESNISYKESETQAKFLSTSFDNAKLSEFYPITRAGKTYGLIRLNQVEKLGIYDWTSMEAIDSGIKYSYTFNFTVRLMNDQVNTSKTFYVTPFFREGDDVTGNTCVVGWSGFPQTAVFNSDSMSMYVENGVQPLKKVSKKTKLCVSISDADGTLYDEIAFSKSIFKHVHRGAQLHTGKGAVTVTGASGAKYSVNISDVQYADTYEDSYTFDDVTDWYEVPMKSTLVYKYRVDYLKGPTKKLEVNNIDTSKKGGSLLYTDLPISVQGNSDDTVYTERSKKLFWCDYKNSLIAKSCVSSKRYKIHVGKYAQYTDNKNVPEPFIKNAKRIRFSVEFNSDAMALSPEKLMKFSGRFVVFERVPTLRTHGSKKDGKVYITRTNDERYE